MNHQPHNQERLVVYGHDYCGHAQMLAHTLNKHQVDYEWRDVMRGEPRFQEELQRLTNGNLSVPTVVFPDQTVMVEPWPGQVLKKLGLKQPNFLEKLFQRWRGE